MAVTRRSWYGSSRRPVLCRRRLLPMMAAILLAGCRVEPRHVADRGAGRLLVDRQQVVDGSTPSMSVEIPGGLGARHDPEPAEVDPRSPTDQISQSMTAVTAPLSSHKMLRGGSRHGRCSATGLGDARRQRCVERFGALSQFGARRSPSWAATGPARPRSRRCRRRKRPGVGSSVVERVQTSAGVVVGA